ncbi:MAG: ABC transporter substrate-binding protein [Rhodospirillaceae bacterium]|nr:ABC transporter substrate-binding protein [Rhodospirillaceae bacterium]
MKKLTFLGVLAALALAAGTAAADMKKVTLGTEGAYPPFNWIDENGDLQGFDVEIGNALCAAANLECTWAVQDWDGIIPGLLAKKYDAIVASMSITEERKKKVDFTGKYYTTPAKFVHMKGSGIEITNEGLEGLAVGVQRATIHENFLRDNYGDIVTIKAYATQDEANLDFVAGRVDLLLADSMALQGGFLDTPDGENAEFIGPDFTDPRWFGDGAGIAVRKGEAELLDALNGAIAAIRADGTYKAINDKYFDFDVYGD